MGNVRRARNFGGNAGAQPGDDHPLPGPADQEDLRPEPSGSRAGSSALLTTRLSDGSQGNGSLVDNRASVTWARYSGNGQLGRTALRRPVPRVWIHVVNRIRDHDLDDAQSS